VKTGIIVAVVATLGVGAAWAWTSLSGAADPSNPHATMALADTYDVTDEALIASVSDVKNGGVHAVADDGDRGIGRPTGASQAAGAEQVPASPTYSASSDAAAVAILKEVAAATFALPTYQASHQYRLTQNGEVRMSVPASVAFQRATPKLSLLQPGMTVQVDGEALAVYIEEIATQHLETHIPTPLTFMSLVERSPGMAKLPKPDVVYLLGDAPFPDDTVVQAPTTLESGRVQVSVTMDQAKFTLEIDPKTHLIQRWAIQVTERDITHELVCDIEIEHAGDTLEAHAFDPPSRNGSQAVRSLYALMNGPGAELLEGKPMPAFDLPSLDGPRVKSADVKARVVVLEFWASWCGACQVTMPGAQSLFADLAGKHDDFQAYAVNVGESAEQARGAIENFGIQSPILLDDDSAVAEAYMSFVLPQTAVMVDGVVQRVYLGGGHEQEMEHYLLEALNTPASTDR